MAVAVSPFESRLDELARKRREVDALEAAWLSDLAEYVQSGEWQADQYVNAAAALRDRCHMTRATASRAVWLAGKLVKLPAIARAFAAGDISREHATVVARAYTRDRVAELDQVEDTFAELASKADPDALRDAVKYVTDAIDGDGGAASDEEIYAKRTCHSSPLLGGVRGDWFLDAEGGDIVKDALAAQMETASVPDDPRTTPQRRADALVDICRRSLANDHPKSAPTRRRGIPHALAVIDIRNYERDHPQLIADIRAEAAYGGRLSRATLDRMACDWDISRIVMDGPSEVLDLGRSMRLPTDKQFKALVVRDQHCQAPGCKVPWQQCTPHHTVWWIEGGPTDLKNLKLLCGYHHRQEHAGNPPKRE